MYSPVVITSCNLHNHCVITSSNLHNHCVITSSNLHNHCIITSCNLHNYCTITSSNLHNHCAITSSNLHNHWPSHQAICIITHHPLPCRNQVRCCLAVGPQKNDGIRSPIAPTSTKLEPPSSLVILSPNKVVQSHCDTCEANRGSWFGLTRLIIREHGRHYWLPKL